jgi:hypothetical protein
MTRRIAAGQRQMSQVDRPCLEPLNSGDEKQADSIEFVGRKKGQPATNPGTVPEGSVSTLEPLTLSNNECTASTIRGACGGSWSTPN